MSQQQTPTPAEMFDQYFGPAIFTPWAEVLLEVAAPQPAERVLDLACGTGTAARHVAPVVGAQGEVVALDISPEMLAVARSRPAPDGAKIDWREGSAMALELPDDAFDLVLCQQGLQFFPDRIAALREMRRVLRHSGRVVLSVWETLERQPVYQALLEAEAHYLGAPVAELATPFSFESAGELRALLEEAGFRRIEVKPRALTAHFPYPERFVELTTLAGAAVVPEVAQDSVSRAALVEAAAQEAEATLRHYRNGDRLSFPMPAFVAVAVA